MTHISLSAVLYDYFICVTLPSPFKEYIKPVPSFHSINILPEFIFLYSQIRQIQNLYFLGQDTSK